jgi:capsular polysaccharide transport system permease protein
MTKASKEGAAAAPLALRAIDPGPADARPDRPEAVRKKRERRRRKRRAVPAAAPEVRPAAIRPRHWAALGSFALIVLAPLAISAWYLFARAADQYHSDVAFSIRSEEPGAAASGILGAITAIGAKSASDADIVFEYIRSQQIVEAVDAELDLRAIFNRAENDPVFTLGPDAAIEALVAHWNRMVHVSFESTTGIIHVQARAFDPEEARAITAAILAESGELVNDLSDQAREDAVRHAREDFEYAEANLAAVRKRLADFRRENRIVDPSADVAGQMGLLGALQGELAQALVERDMLLSFAAEDDQRVIQARRRIDAITKRIDEERASLGIAGATGELTEVIGTYEELLVDLEFANTAYTQTLSGLIAARAEAQRQSSYLAPHVSPTLAETPLYPRRLLLAGLIGLFLALGWGVALLLYYNVRDNR